SIAEQHLCIARKLARDCDIELSVIVEVPDNDAARREGKSCQASGLQSSIAVAQQHGNSERGERRADYNVLLAITIHVSNRHSRRLVAQAEDSSCLEGAITIAEQQLDFP